MRKTWSWSVPGQLFVGKTHERIQEICQTAGLAGIEGGEFLFDSCTEAELESLGAAYQKAGVRIETYHLPFMKAEYDFSSFYETVRRRTVEVAKRGIERSVLLGSKVGIQHPGSTIHGVDVEGLDRYLREFGKSLTALLPLAEQLGYTIAVENMPPRGGQRFGAFPEHFERIIKEFDHPHLGFCLDTGHALIALGPDHAHEMFEVMAPKMVAFHFADTAGDRDSHLAPGRGLVDWNYTFRRAAEIGFSGCACIETPPFAPGPDYSAEAYRQMVVEAEALVEKAFRG